MKLQKAPNGLLGALNLKALGAQPDEFAGTLAPTYDVRDHYQSDLLRVQLALTALATGTFVTCNLNVPGGEVWRVRAIHGSLQLASGDTAGAGIITIGIRTANAQRCHIASLLTPALAFGFATSYVCAAQCDIVLPAGAGCQAQFNGQLTIAGASLLECVALVQRFEA